MEARPQYSTSADARPTPPWPRRRRRPRSAPTCGRAPRRPARCAAPLLTRIFAASKKSSRAATANTQQPTVQNTHLDFCRLYALAPGNAKLIAAFSYQLSRFEWTVASKWVGRSPRSAPSLSTTPGLRSDLGGAACRPYRPPGGSVASLSVGYWGSLDCPAGGQVGRLVGPRRDGCERAPRKRLPDSALRTHRRLRLRGTAGVHARARSRAHRATADSGDWVARTALCRHCTRGMWNQDKRYVVLFPGEPGCRSVIGRIDRMFAGVLVDISCVVLHESILS